MKVLRLSLFTFLLLGCFVTIVLLAQKETPAPFSATLSPLFQELGKPMKSLDRIASQILPIDAIDEKALGDELKARFAQLTSPHNQEKEDELNALIKSLTQNSLKPFQYTVFLTSGPPNAFAMPGGVICVTDGLLDILQTEDELVAILGHEIGHIEKGHCFDMCREILLRKKFKTLTIPTYVTEIFHSLAEVTFSKAQEDEADDYGFRLLVKHEYDPFSLASAFNQLIETNQEASSPNFMKDFFSTHPYLEIRKEHAHAKALKWQHKHPENHF